MPTSIDFFKFARERHAIHIRREEGQEWPWTDDLILQEYKFTNVFRELDKVTVWYRENIREKISPEQILLATVIFRFFNHVGTGQSMFRTLSDWRGKGRVLTAFQDFAENREISVLQDAIENFSGGPPFTSGAYIHKSPDGMTKVPGLLWCVDQFDKTHNPLKYNEAAQTVGTWFKITEFLLDMQGKISLESVWDWLRQYPYIGDFVAYEMVTDLRHTKLLDQAPDIMTWANPGPGAMRGLNRMHGRPLNHSQPKHVFVMEMREILRLSKMECHWPQESESHPYWEMRDVEHTLCEFDKYQRVLLGEGRPRGKYRHK